MALPYYMPSVAKPKKQPTNQYYRSPPPPMELMHHIQLQQDMQKMGYHQPIHSIYYGPAPGYEHNFAANPYLPTYPPAMLVPQSGLPFQGIRMPFPHVPAMMYPAVQLPSPQEYRPEQRYLSQLKSAAARLTETDIKATAQSEGHGWRHVVSEDKPVPESEPDSTAPTLNSGEPSLTQSLSLGPTYNSTERKQLPSPKYLSSISSKEADAPIRKPILRTRSGTPVLEGSDESSESNKQQSSPYSPFTTWFPRPVTHRCEHVYIGENGTFVPTTLYASIPWQSYEESARILMEFIFDDGSLATHDLDGVNRLDPKIVSDVITHISYKSSVSEEHVRSAIVKLCNDTARHYLGYM